MTATIVLPLVAIITLCAVYLWLTLDAALDRSEQRWRGAGPVSDWEPEESEWSLWGDR